MLLFYYLVKNFVNVKLKKAKFSFKSLACCR